MMKFKLLVGIIILIKLISSKNIKLSLENDSNNDLLKFINNSVSPCENFYEFACGNFKTETKVNYSQFHLTSESIQEQLTSILESKSTVNDPNYIKNVKDFYASCMNTGEMRIIKLKFCI